MKLNCKITSLNNFNLRSAKHALLFNQLPRKEVLIEWTLKCEYAFTHLKHFLSKTTILLRPVSKENLFVN